MNNSDKDDKKPHINRWRISTTAWIVIIGMMFVAAAFRLGTMGSG